MLLALDRDVCAIGRVPLVREGGSDNLLALLVDPSSGVIEPFPLVCCDIH